MTLKIGVFDSGVGGITVLSELKQKMGFADYVYLGDTAHVPYGTKSPAQIEKLSIECALLLKQKNIDALVVACNTASSWALPAIRKVMAPIPVFGVVEPGVEAALNTLKSFSSETETLPILVLATRATVRSQAYGKALRLHFDQLGVEETRPNVLIIEKACPLLVPMIEEGWTDHSILHLTIAEYVKPYLSQFKAGIALLGCTHYPWIHSAFEQALPGWTVVNSAEAIVSALRVGGELTPTDTLDESKQEIEWIFTDPEAVPEFARQWIQNGVNWKKGP